MVYYKMLVIVLAATYLSAGKCKKDSPVPPVVTPPVATPTVYTASSWITSGDKRYLLTAGDTSIPFKSNSTSSTSAVIDIDSASQFQSIDGFGYSLTGGSAMLINKLPGTTKTDLLNELFTATGNGIGVSYLRISLGASDLSEQVFSYADLPTGQVDTTLSTFNLSYDTLHVIPILKQIVGINPSIKIMASPWSAPVWMKDNKASIGGSLLTQYYSAYAKYFVKYIKAMKVVGINIDAITVQNEPQHGGNNPSMVMSAAQQADFVKNHLGPQFRNAGLSTKIIVWDHNCDNPGYPIEILNDATAKQYIDGSAFHLYSGDISAMSNVRANHPDKNLYFTEQWTGANGSFTGDLVWHTKNVIIGSMRNWSRNALEWNLAADPTYKPHTVGGCTECKGALTLDTYVSRNVSYYIIAQASKFITPGSIRISSTTQIGLPNVAFVRPDGKKVFMVLNETTTPLKFNIKYNNTMALTTLPAESVATYVW